MNYCSKCGTPIAEGSRFCPSCGTPAGAPAAPENRQPPQTEPNPHNQQAYGSLGQPQGHQPGHQPQGSLETKLSAALNTPDATAAFTPADIGQNKVMGVLAYLGILVLVPILAARESPFARFHANQGLLLCMAAILYGVAYSILTPLVLAISWRLYFVVSLLGLVGVVFLVLAVIGIINVVNGRARELPLIGRYRILK